MNITTTLKEGTRTEHEQKKPTILEPIRYCLYVRKSTESEEKQILSIDSQIKEMMQLAVRENLNVVEMRRESHSAKATGQRPVFNGLLTDIRSGKFNGILTWAPDRLSRNAGDLGALVDLMDQKSLIEIRTYGQRFENNPNEKFLLMILGSQAKLENDNKSVNVKRGMRTRAEMGLWPQLAPLGYLNQYRLDKKCEVIVDPIRGPIVKQIFEKVGYEGWSGRKLFKWLNFEMKFRTRGDKPISLGSLYRMLESTFYYGRFEYPVKSGLWYQGKHEPLITEDLFKKVRVQMQRSEMKDTKKDFAFTKLIVCGLCGSGFTAQDKYKELKDGTVVKYIYYGCTRARDKDCKNSYLREEELVSQLLKIIDQLSINELGMRHQFDDEVRRFNRFQTAVLGAEKKADPAEADINIRAYAKYLLREGSIVEKRELLCHLRSRLIFKDKKIELLPQEN